MVLLHVYFRSSKDKGRCYDSRWKRNCWSVYGVRVHPVLYVTGISIVCGVVLYLYLVRWGGHCCPMHCDLFKIYCAPPNLGITRTSICRLNSAQRPIFSGLRFFNEPEISDSGPRVPPRELVLRSFTSWKNPSTSAGFENPRTLDLEASTLPRNHRGRQVCMYVWYVSMRACMCVCEWVEVSLCRYMSVVWG